jgi:hypothetical protein
MLKARINNVLLKVPNDINDIAESIQDAQALNRGFVSNCDQVTEQALADSYIKVSTVALERGQQCKLMKENAAQQRDIRLYSSCRGKAGDLDEVQQGR